MIESEGACLSGAELSPEGVANRFAEICDMSGKQLSGALEQCAKYVAKAADAEYANVI